MSDYYAATFLKTKNLYQSAVVPLVPLRSFGQPTGYDALASVKATLLSMPNFKEAIGDLDLKDHSFETYIFSLSEEGYPLCLYSYQYLLAQRSEMDQSEFSFNFSGISLDRDERSYTSYDRDPIIIAEEELASKAVEEGDGEPLLCYKIYPLVYAEGNSGSKGTFYSGGSVSPSPPMDIGTILNLQLMAHAADREAAGSLFTAGNIFDSMVSFALRQDSSTGHYTAHICRGSLCLLYRGASRFNEAFYHQAMETVAMVDEMTGGHYHKSIEAMERNASIKKEGEDKLLGYYVPNMDAASSELIHDFRIFALTGKAIESDEDTPDSSFYTYGITQCSDPVIMNGRIFPYDPLLQQ
jgi:hypothetical protein